ncbi:MAG: sulfide:quinone reductase [Sulfurovum sp. PC08-66]|jgi:sulfide:quinone oxidoreductase|nr:MAG: sulfide:quinone reductase [Sulfurovum sp. PC08-66]
MARLIVMGAGVSGHTAATFAKKYLGKSHEVVVVAPNSNWNWIPSNIWVGVGEMTKEDVTFPLAPVYQKAGIDFRQAKAVSIHPEGKESSDKPYITIEYTIEDKAGQSEELEYDYLINATGPKLNFGATAGLGEGSNIGEHTVSVCTADHAVHANQELQACIEKMKNGERQKFLIGTGHGMCTCQGAAFEYIFNIEKTINDAGVRDMADLKWISNESFLGDFGMGGIHFSMGGYATSSKIFSESLYSERGLDWIIGAHVTKVEKGRIEYELLDGSMAEETFDFAMLIPPFAGVGLKAYAKDGVEITDKLFAPNGFMKVDAKYDAGSYENWKASDWPHTLQNPTYGNIFAVGIAFAPPHPISKPMVTPNGTTIVPTAPRTGMPSAMMGKAVVQSICDMIKKGATEPTHTACMAQMGAACVASAGKGLFAGTAAAMTVYPIVPDFEKYPGVGRDMNGTSGELGLAAHWIKHILHHLFIWKAKLKPGWTLIPE